MTTSFSKPKHSLPKLELVLSDATYAFNFNPKNQFIKTRLKKQYDLLRKILPDDDACYYSLKLFPELSPTGRLHFHGLIKFKNPFYFYYRVLPKLISHGTVVIKEIEDFECWTTYIQKQSKIFIKGLTLRLPFTFPVVHAVVI